MDKRESGGVVFRECSQEVGTVRATAIRLGLVC